MNMPTLRSMGKNTQYSLYAEVLSYLASLASFAGITVHRHEMEQSRDVKENT